MRHAEPNHWRKLIIFLLMATVAAAGCSGDGDDDPCADVTCGGHGTCSDQGGEAVCTCEAGYKQTENKKNCVEVSTCTGTAEDCCGHGTCVQEGINRYCQCEQDYTVDPDDPLCCIPCKEIDETCTSVEQCCCNSCFIEEGEATGYCSGCGPMIQACISDCKGDQTSAGCLAASSVCHDDVLPDKLQIDFGDASLVETLNRDLTIRDLGDESLVILNLYFDSGDDTQFSVDFDYEMLPYTLAAQQEMTIVVTYNPSLGGSHASVLRIISNDPEEALINVELVGTAL